MCGCGRTSASRGSPGARSFGPTRSKKMYAPTMRRLANGSTPPTSKRPRSRRRCRMTSSIMAGAPGWPGSGAARQHRQHVGDELVELLEVVAQELRRRLVRDLACLVEHPVSELDVGLGRVHLRRVEESEDAAQVLLPHRGADRARRG